MKNSKIVKLMLSMALVLIFIGCGADDEIDTTSSSNGESSNNSGSNSNNNNGGTSNSEEDSILKASTVPFIFTVEAKGGNTIDIKVAGLNKKYENQTNYSIEWGDGTSANNIKDSIQHTYPNSGTYTIAISGIYSRIFIYELVSVEQWGDMQWTNMASAFSRFSIDNKKIVFNAEDTPDLSKVEDMSSMFARIDFNGDLSSWDVSKVKDMSNMFSSSSFNQDISMWDTSKVEDMSGMFSSAFNQDISSWDVSKVKDMSRMFSSTSFNQDLGKWDVSSVENMHSMFSGNEKFNQDISMWDIANVKDIESMFRSAKSFNQNLGSWNLSGIEEEVYDFLENCGLSINNYDKTLIGWANNGNIIGGITLEMGNIKYSKKGESARFKLINEYSWNITDGGLVE